MAQDGAPPGTASQDLAAAHAELLKQEDIQFAFPPGIEREVRPIRGPNWLTELFEALGPLFQVLAWGLLAAVVLLVLWLIVRESGALRPLFRRKPRPPSLYQPDAETARALLADADALAAQGLYAEAVHTLLLRSIEDMQRFRPKSVRPSATSRDIAGLPVLPEAARGAFSSMARMVETSLFGGRPVGEGDFADCRRAYEAFAFPRVWS